MGIAALAALTGGYLVADGLHVMVTGRYIGPERPGPWATLLESVGLDVFKLGPLFVALGLLWLGWLVALLARWPRAAAVGYAASVLTLWYLPFGTLIAVVTLVALRAGVSRRRLE